MSRNTVISAKIPDEVYEELALRIPEGERSDFIRDAIKEKLYTVPRPDRIHGLEQRINILEAELAGIKQSLVELEILTFDKKKVNLHAFCLDDTDHKIVDYLLHYKGATTPEMADYLKTNRWHVLNRLRRLQKRSKLQVGRPMIEYSAAERQGKRKAWWLVKEIVEA